MSGGLEVLALQEGDVTKMLAAGVHLGSGNADFQMLQYVYKRKSDGTHIINLRKTWEKLLLAARMIVSIENPIDVAVISGKQHAQRAILKFAGHTGSTPVAGRFTPGAFTNQIQAAFREPRLLVVSDPRIDHQAINESSYVNIPTIAFCNTDAPLRYIDVAIPCNTKAPHSVGLMWWMLAREVLRMRGTIGRDTPWSIMPDLYFYRDPEEVEKEEREAAAAKAATAQDDWGSSRADAPPVVTEDWGDAAQPAAPASDFGAAVPSAAPAAAAPAPLSGVPSDNWGAPTSSDWGAEPTEGASTEWAASTAGGDASNW